VSDALIDAIVDEALTKGLGARPLHAMLAKACQRVFFEAPSRIDPLDEGTFTVTLGPEALVDGSYELACRRRKRSADEQRKLVADVERRLGNVGRGAAESADG